MHRIRAFIAVNLPIPVINQVTQMQTQLRGRAQQLGMKVAWVPSASMHVTLKFLAEIPEEGAWVVRDTLMTRLADHAGFQLKISGLGAFPNRAKPRVVWVGIQSEDDALIRLAQDVEQWLDELGFPKETRPFHPHLTLGRVKQGTGDMLEGLDDTNFGNWPVNRVTLYQSILKPQGAEYVALAQIPLASSSRGSQPEEPMDNETSLKENDHS